MIRIITALDITKEGVAVFNRKWQAVHLRQGDMDGACAVYSLMMNLLILKVLNRNQITDLNTKFKGNTARGRLYKEFFNVEGLCRDGFYLADIQDKLSHSFAKIVKSVSKQYGNTQAEQSEFLEDVKNNINQERPLMASISFKGGAHAILIIGYEERNGNLSKLFCLDPALDLGTSAYWNAVMRVNEASKRNYPHSYIANSCITNSWYPDVSVSESLAIIKK